VRRIGIQALNIHLIYTDSISIIGTLSNLQPISVSSVCTQLDFGQFNSALNLNKLQENLLNTIWPIDNKNSNVNYNKFPLIVNKQFNNIGKIN
jgi:hypothetical protein